MKKTFFIITLFSVVLLSACSVQQPQPSSSTTPAQNQKVGDSVKTGKLLKLGEKYAIQETGKQPADVDSYSIDLSGYVGQKVQVTGQYSGDTLFISKVEVQ
jgi:PBP1b-binding outer membrane lipoprotein LpoB